MFFQLDTEIYSELKFILNDILNYNKLPSSNIFKRINKMPKNV